MGSEGMFFWASLYGKDVSYPEIEKALGIKINNSGRINAPEDMPYDTDDYVHYEEIKWLLDIIENNKETLIRLGVELSASSIWMYYHYDSQCNMEFDPSLLERIGKLGMKLCVSCAQYRSSSDEE